MTDNPYNYETNEIVDQLQNHEAPYLALTNRRRPLTGKRCKEIAAHYFGDRIGKVGIGNGRIKWGQVAQFFNNEEIEE